MIVEGAAATCQPGAVAWIEHVFHDCIYDTRDLVGFSFGLCSIACWVVAQVPQLITNYRRQSAEALSAFFLAEWLLGDTCNLLGALLKGDQPETVVLTAQYFIVMDAVLLVQYLYYTSIARRRERTYTLARRRKHGHHPHHHPHHHLHHHKHSTRAHLHANGNDGSAAAAAAAGMAASGQALRIRSVHSGSGAGVEEEGPEIASIMGGEEIGSNGAVGRVGGSGLSAAVTTVAIAAAACSTVLLLRGPLHPASSTLARRLLMQGADGLLGAKEKRWREITGSTLGYVSSVLYLASRVSQIVRNAKRRSAEGLASSMFACAVSANLFYGFGILLRSRTDAALLSSLPWVIGSLGTVAMDTVILTQAAMFGSGPAEAKKESDEEEPLLALHEETQSPAHI